MSADGPREHGAPRRRAVPLWPEAWTSGGAEPPGWEDVARRADLGIGPVVAPADYAAAVHAVGAAVMAADAGVAALEGAPVGAGPAPVDLRRLDLPPVDLPPLAHARLPPEPAGTLVTTASWARIALDHDPSLGEDAPEALLGPWLATLSVRRPEHRRALLAAVAHGAFTMAPGDDKSPLRAVQRVRPPLPPEEAASLAAAWRAPLVPLRVEPRGALSPVVPVDPWWVPATLPPWDEVGAVASAALTPGSLLFARVVPGAGPGGGPLWLGALALPEVPPPAWWHGVLARHGLVERVRNRALRHEEVLRRVGHHLVGEAHRWAWARANGGLRAPEASSP